MNNLNNKGAVSWQLKLHHIYHKIAKTANTVNCNAVALVELKRIRVLLSIKV